MNLAPCLKLVVLMMSNETWCMKPGIQSTQCTGYHGTSLDVMLQDSHSQGRNIHVWMNIWPVKCLRIKQIKCMSKYKYKGMKYSKDHFVREGPKTLYRQNYLLKDLWIGLYYHFTRYFAKKCTLNAPSPPRPKPKSPWLFPKLSNPSSVTLQ